MIVAPEISTLTDKTVAISDKASSPVIAKRSAETVVVTPNAKTVVIGGLMETQKIESIRKVPILGDIPVLGFPFKRTVKSDVKKELMIFLTPYIVRDPKRMENLAAVELHKTELVPEAFNPEDFGKYLDNPSLFPGPRDPAPSPTVRRATAVTPAKKQAPELPPQGAVTPKTR
jgi:general secretion pathway protein D